MNAQGTTLVIEQSRSCAGCTPKPCPYCKRTDLTHDQMLQHLYNSCREVTR